MPIEPQTVALLDGLRAARPDVDVVHSSLDDFASAIVAQRDKIERVAKGELRDPGRLANGMWLIPGVLSSRIRLTQDNRARETELCLWAEPFSHLASCLLGTEYPDAYLRRSWRYLLENHAHDSICGCSPDQIHKDMAFRFDQSRMINGKVIDNALDSIARRVELSDIEGEDLAMVVFNPTQADIDGPIDLELWFDEKTSNVYGEFFNYESKVGFRLYDAEDREIPYDYVSHAPRRRRYSRNPRKAPHGQECYVVRVTAPLSIPAFGYTTITCKPEPKPTRHPKGNLLTGDRTLENEHLRVEVRSNGSISLTDKGSGAVYDRLLIFEERADIGDGWFHGVAVNDRIYSSTACAADVAIIVDGAQKATLRISNHLEIPECFEFDTKMRRSDRTATLLIESDVTLRAGAKHVEIRTVIDNQIRDHRVRVLFESGADTKTYLADSAFDVVERRIALPEDNHTYKELAVETTPQANWTAVFDANRGLAVVAPGLPETAVCDVPQRPLALTLLRGFRRTVFRSDDEIGGQSLGPHEFRYGLVPLAGDPNRTALARIAQRLAGGVRAVEVTKRTQAPRDARDLPRTLGQLTLKPGAAVLSSFRRHPESHRLEIRLFNPYGHALEEKLAFACNIASAQLTDFEGRETETIQVTNNTVALAIAPKQIVTVTVQVE